MTLKLTVPLVCKFCGRTGTVKLERTVKAGEIELAWCCAACARDWPVDGDEREAPVKNARR